MYRIIERKMGGGGGGNKASVFEFQVPASKVEELKDCWSCTASDMVQDLLITLWKEAGVQYTDRARL